MNLEPTSRWFGLMALTALALYLCWMMIQPFVDVLVWAMVLAIVFYPVNRRLAAKTRRPALSAVISLALTIIVVIVPLLAIGAAVVAELSTLAQQAPERLHTLWANPELQITLNIWIAKLKPYIKLDDVVTLVTPSNISQLASRIGQGLVKSTGMVVGGAFGALLKIIFVIFTLYYFFRDGERIRERLPTVIPLPRHQAEAILTRAREIIDASVYGVLTIAALQGALGGMMFWVLGLPSAILWGVVMALMATIPLAGAFIVWIPAAIYLALTGHLVKALILTLWGTMVIGLADNLLRPRLVGHKARMHELLIFFSVLGGLNVFGVIGILLGPVVLAITQALMEITWGNPPPNA